MMSVVAQIRVERRKFPVLAEAARTPTDWHFVGLQKVGVNAWLQDNPVSIDNQDIIRSNRDVAYSRAAVDVPAGVSFGVPAAGPEISVFQVIHAV